MDPRLRQQVRERAEPLDQEMNVRILSCVLALITKAYPAIDIIPI